MEQRAYMITMGIRVGESELNRDQLSHEVENWAAAHQDRFLEELGDPDYIAVYHFFLPEVLRTIEERSAAIAAFNEFKAAFPQATQGEVYSVVVGE